MGEVNQAMPQQLRLSVRLPSLSLVDPSPPLGISEQERNFSIQTAAVSLARIHTLLSTRKLHLPVPHLKCADSPYPLFVLPCQLPSRPLSSSAFTFTTTVSSRTNTTNTLTNGSPPFRLRLAIFILNETSFKSS